VRFRHKPDDDEQDTGESKLDGDQGFPLIGQVNGKELSSDGNDQLSKRERELVGADHESTNLEGRNLRDKGDEDGLSKTDTESNDDGTSQPVFPVVGSDLENGTDEQDEDGSDQGVSAHTERRQG
jgi:hypothetical protein